MQRVARRRSSEVRVEESYAVVTSSGVGVPAEERRQLEVRKFVTDPAYVRVSFGVTRSIAQFESLRVDIAVTVPCYAEEVEAVQESTGELVAAMLDAEVDKYLNAGG